MTEQVCFDTLQFDEPWTLENYLKVGGYQAWKKILAGKDPAGRCHRGSQGIRPARPWRRGFPDRPEVELHAA